MKLSLTILGLMTISFSAFATVEIEDTTPMRNCMAKVEKMIGQVGTTAGLGKSVGHITGVAVLSKRKYSNGTIVYALGGGPLAASNMEGYWSGSGATTLVTLTKNSCDILKTEINTGKNFLKDIDLEGSFDVVE